MLIIYDKPENESFKDWLEKIQYKAALAITYAIRGTSRERVYNEHGLDSLANKPGVLKIGWTGNFWDI